MLFRSFIRVLIHDWPSKKGWCEVSRPSMLPNANMLECTWLYNWDAYAARSANIEYVPEKWSTSWPGFSTINSSQNVSHLLSYNEPDHVEQSNITVDQAVNQWPELLKTGLRVGSPATTDFSWLYSFMDKCKAKKYRVDYVVIHCYWPSMTAQQWYNDLKAVYDRTGCPIWIKEWNNGANWTTESWPDGWKEAYEKQVKELGPILNVLDTAHFIERYSIYNEVGWKRMVIDDFGKITPAGEMYRDNKPTFAYRKESEVLPPTWSAVSPTMSNVTITGDTAICVTWNDRNGGLVDEFIIERNDNSGGFVEIGRVPRTDLQFFDKDALSISGISKYRVKSKMRTGTIYTSGEISSMKSWGDAFFQYGTASTKTKDELLSVIAPLWVIIL